jgi:hypothetical protein
MLTAPSFALAGRTKSVVESRAGRSKIRQAAFPNVSGFLTGFMITS